jgi:hypothetical protein
MSTTMDDILELSDEDFLAQQHTFEASAEEAMKAPAGKTKEEEEAEAEQLRAEAEADKNTEESDTQSDESQDSEDDDDEQTDEENSGDVSDTSDESQDEEGETDNEADADDTGNSDDVSDPSTEGEIDYKAEYEKVLAPFKANGRTIKVDSMDDAVALMQMGANYNKKMSDIKPHLKIVKTLEANGLLDSDKLNNLIDLSNKDVGAIRKLVKDSGIDTFDLDSEDGPAYQPKNHQVDDKTYNLGETLDNLRGTDKFETTSKIVGEEWDDASRAALYENPNVLNVIHQHVQSGQYEVIADRVEQLRMMNRLPEGISNLDAYGVVAKQLAEETQQAQKADPVTPAVKKPVPKTDAKREKQRKAAGGTRSRPGAVSETLDSEAILDMSDEAFEKATKDGLFKTIS